jgi:hypothetical protein
MSENQSNWLIDNRVFLDEDMQGYVGFIYLITNTVNGKKYIGKKIFTNTLRVKQKNKTRRKVKRKESDWRDYYGSSPALSLDVEHFGKSNFKREIIKLCKSKSELTYFEAKEQFFRGCLESPEWYNEHIMCRVRKANLKFSSSR